MPGEPTLYYPLFEPSSALFLRGTLLLFDSLATLVPEQAMPHFKYSVATRRLLDKDPTLVVPYPVSNAWVDMSEAGYSRLIGALGIVARRRGPHRNVGILVNRYGELTFGGHIPMHVYKLPARIREDLLALRLMFAQPASELTTTHGFGGVPADQFYLVDEEASYLIISQTSTSIATMRGWNTVTDRGLDYTVAEVNRLEQHYIEQRFIGSLAAAIMRLAIPRELEEISETDFVALRERHQPLREEFPVALSTLARLGPDPLPHDPELLAQRVQVLAPRFITAVEKFRHDRLWRSVKSYVPMTVGFLITLAAGLVGKAVGVKLKPGIDFTIKVIERQFESGGAPPHETRTHRLLADLKDDILDTAKTKRIVRPGRRPGTR